MCVSGRRKGYTASPVILFSCIVNINLCSLKSSNVPCKKNMKLVKSCCVDSSHWPWKLNVLNCALDWDRLCCCDFCSCDWKSSQYGCKWCTCTCFVGDSSGAFARHKREKCFIHWHREMSTMLSVPFLKCDCKMLNQLYTLIAGCESRCTLLTHSGTLAMHSPLFSLTLVQLVPSCSSLLYDFTACFFVLFFLTGYTVL